MKKGLFLGSVVVATILFTGCSGQMAQLATSQMGQQMAQSAAQNSNQKITEKTAMASKSGLKGNCIPRANGGQVGWTDMASKYILNPLLESAIEEASGEKVKIPTKILDTCEADAKLQYVKALTGRYYKNLDLASTKFLDSMKQTKAIREYKAELADQKGMEDKADSIEGKKEHNEKIFALMKDSEIKDKKLFSEATGIFTRTTTLFTPELLGWDKELAEFSKDNLVWGVKNIGDIKTILSQVATIAEVPVTGTKLIKSAAASSNISISKKDAQIAASEIKVPSEKELAQEAEEI